MKRILTCLVLMVCSCCTAFAQPSKKEAQTQKMLEAAAAKGKPVATESTVRNNVSAQAVMIPQVDARRIFGKEIANNYAIVEVNVGNKSPDAALIIHGVFIDYSGWALSGITEQQSGTTGKPFEMFQSSTSPGHIASEEYRIVRDQAQNAALFSGRSWTMRALTLAASIAGAYPFGLSKLEVSYFSAFSGVLVPGIEKLWPDGTPEQLLRISDYGYRTNKVIPKESAEIVVCFFPIERFLTPGFRKLFLKSPALFFAPLQMLADKKLEKDVKVLLKTIDEDLDQKKLAKLMPCYIRIVKGMSSNATTRDLSLRDQINENAEKACLSQFGLSKASTGKIDLISNSTAAKGPETKSESSGDKFKQFLALDFISQMSLNHVSVTIDGAMTIDTSSMAPKIEGLKFDSADKCGGDQTSCFWSDLASDTGTRTGTILGSYLTGGTIEIAEEKDLELTDVTTVHEGSNDQMLNFSFKLTKPVPSGTKIHFKVTKALTGVAALNAKTTESKTLEYVLAGPAISESPQFDQATGTLMLTGKGFLTAPSNLAVKLHPPTGADLDIKPLMDSSSTDTLLVFKIPAASLPTPGCWKVLALIGTQPVLMPEENGVLVRPTVTSATLGAGTPKKITIAGTGLDSVDCNGGALSYTLVNNADASKTFNLVKDASSNATSATFPLPALATAGSWKVKVLFDGKPLKDYDLTIP